MFELKQTLTLLQTIKQIHLLLIRIKKKKKKSTNQKHTTTSNKPTDTNISFSLANSTD